MLILLLVGVAGASSPPIFNPAFNLCNDANLSSVYDDSSMVEKLFNWCVNDARCCADYHQDYRQNFTIFRHLLEPKFDSQKEYGLMTLFKDLLCNDKELEEINKYLWLSYLSKERIKGAPLCDVNHHLVFNQHELKYECQCKSDRACTDKLFDLVPFYIVLVLIGVLALLFFGGNIYKQATEIQTLARATSDKKAAEVLKKVIS